MSTYCTNCGKETRHSICHACGVKNGKINNFCRWCGTAINPHASICVNCKEQTNIERIPILLKILYVILSILSIFVGLVIISADSVAAGVFFIVLSLFLFSSPVVVWIKKATHNCKKRNLARTCLYVAQVLSLLLVFVLAVVVDIIVNPVSEQEISVEESIPWPVEIACTEAKSYLAKDWNEIPTVTGEIIYNNGFDYIVVVKYNFLWNEKLSSDIYSVEGSIAYHVYSTRDGLGYVKGRTEDQDYDYNYTSGSRLELLKAKWGIK